MTSVLESEQLSSKAPIETPHLLVQICEYNSPLTAQLGGTIQTAGAQRDIHTTTNTAQDAIIALQRPVSTKDE